MTDPNKSYTQDQNNNTNNGSMTNFYSSQSPNEKVLVRRDSLGNFTQYNNHGTPKNTSMRMDSTANMKSPNNINNNLNTSNFLMDESFEKAMMEAKRNVKIQYKWC
jgi:hypothetical protein